MKLSGWGRFPRIEAQCRSFQSTEELRNSLDLFEDCIAYGMGRSYGDSALSQRALLTRRFDKVLEFDAARGVVVCESGVTLAGLIEAFLPRYWFLPVTPGTRFVTVGGAIASDVHGKSHHRDGCFSQWVISFDLMLPSGDIVRCSREENRELFLATCGGMGLTGIILTAVLRLVPVRSGFIRESILRCSNLEEVFSRFEDYASSAFSVAWIDCLSGGKALGRSIVMAGDWAGEGSVDLPVKKALTVPIDFPGACLNQWSVSAFNQLYYHSRPDKTEGRLTHVYDFFYPLDSIHNWNRIYGRKGFCQYQVALPREASLKGLSAILQKTVEAGMGSFLAVLKLMGPENDNFLSFPMEGYTLALDFKCCSRLWPFLEALDRIVLDYGGRLYLAKDARMSWDVFRMGYPRWERFRALRERYGMHRKFNSLQSIRLGV